MTYDAHENENVSRRKGDRKHLRAATAKKGTTRVAGVPWGTYCPEYPD